MSGAEHLERGAFDERGALDENRDREAPSVAEAGARSPASMLAYIAMGLGTLMAIWLLVILPMQSEADEASPIHREEAGIDRSDRSLDRSYPGTGFDAEDTRALTQEEAAVVEAEDASIRAMRLQIRKLELELERARAASNHEARSLALQMQIEAAREAEADRVKRLRSDIIISDFGKADKHATVRDIATETAREDGNASLQSADVAINPARENQAADPLTLLRALGASAPGDGGEPKESVPPPLLDELRASGQLTETGGDRP